MIKFIKARCKKVDKKLAYKRKSYILSKCERIIRGSKIKIRLMVSCGLLVMIPLLIIGITSVLQSKEAMNSKISNLSSQIMEEIGVNISSEMNNESNLARSSIIEPDFQNYLRNKIGMNYLEAYCKSNDLGEAFTSKVAAKSYISSFGVISIDNTKIGNFSSEFSEDIIKSLLDLSSKEKEKFIWSLQKKS